MNVGWHRELIQNLFSADSRSKGSAVGLSLMWGKGSSTRNLSSVSIRSGKSTRRSEEVPLVLLVFNFVIVNLMRQREILHKRRGLSSYLVG